ncbi:unnamed protein product [Pieris macdunnoughi]|uniref:Uncharacterized protein n=1 Tax=Pieris macdunnoughi TaxID=345717 RepID=A0A821Y2C0_9NEOP|nr:unnamed protein product [Pieris macdunnoughi]
MNTPVRKSLGEVLFPKPSLTASPKASRLINTNITPKTEAQKWVNTAREALAKSRNLRTDLKLEIEKSLDNLNKIIESLLPTITPGTTPNTNTTPTITTPDTILDQPNTLEERLLKRLDAHSKLIQESDKTMRESIPKFLQHDFIARQQAEFFQTTKKNLEVGQVLVVADFSENYSFLLQNSVQGAYWNNSQATIHPFACYYRSIDENVDNIVPLNLIIISDNLTHNTTAVYSFQEVLTSFLKNKIPDISKIIYFSDGAASQYKNRYNLLNLLHHEEDFQIPAEWHYFATSHGKGPSDGLGGTLKRKVDRANLQSKADDQIQTPDELFQWAKENVHGINCDFVSNEQIQRTQKKLNQRFKNALPVQGIRNCHAAIPISSDVMRVKTSSSSEEGKDFRLKNTDIYEFVEEPYIKSRLRKRKGATTVTEELKKKNFS